MGEQAAETPNPFVLSDDPYAKFAELRRTRPVLETEAGWMLFRRADVEQVYLDPAASVETKRAQFMPLARSMIMRDPPDHARLRRQLSKAFTPATMNGLRPMIQGIADRRLDEMAAAGESDFIEALAFPLPFEVISGMLGVPDSANDQVRGWSSDLTKVIDPQVSAKTVEQARRSEADFKAYFADLIAWKRKAPGQDLISLLIAAENDDGSLTTEELVEQLALLYIAGHENTTNLLGNGLLLLLENSEQRAMWASDASLDGNAAEEILRLEPPLHFGRRTLRQPLRLPDAEIPAGAFVLTCIASANRDEAFWGSDGDRLDLRRADASRHLTFAYGLHHCLGAALARIEIQVVLGKMIRRFGKIDLLEDELSYHPRVMMRGLQQMRVRLAA